MRLLIIAAAGLALTAPLAAQPAPPSPPSADKKDNANPCRDEVAAALAKLRKTSWFRMDTTMITEDGPTSMTVDYVLPDKMHQKVTVLTTQAKSEVILVGSKAWSNDGQGWTVLSEEIAGQLSSQMYETAVEQQGDVGNYACKGKSTVDGRDVLSYKLNDEGPKESTEPPKNEAYRLFYVDSVTGLPSGNALVAPGREAKPFFKTTYSYPVDIKIDPPAAANAGEPAKP